jgi:hypothetical protein
MNNNNTDPCANIFSNGLRFSWDTFSNSPYKSSFSCKLKTEDGKFVKMTVPEDYNVIAFLNSFPSYNETELINEDGLYTWIMYSLGSEQSIQFAAVAVKNAFEVGTLHKALALKMGAARIHGAGELLKTGSQIIYNLQSGSFTKYWLNSREKSKKRMRCSSDQLEDKLNSEFVKRFSGITLNYTNKTMINESIPIKYEDIQTYKHAGIIVELYDTEDMCKASLNGGKRRTMKRRNFRKSRRLHSFR